MSYSFDGADDFIDCGAAIGPSGGFTVSAWIHPITLTSSGMVVSMYEAAA